jgi:Family of unknown function (DUF6072)
MPDRGMFGNAVKLLSEVVIMPGTSEFLEGHITSGVGHAALGFAARALLGVPGLLLVAADSYSSSVTGKYLHQQIMDSLQSLTGRGRPSVESTTTHT